MGKKVTDVIIVPGGVEDITVGWCDQVRAANEGPRRVYSHGEGPNWGEIFANLGLKLYTRCCTRGAAYTRMWPWPRFRPRG